jgi:hypothetical protein
MRKLPTFSTLMSLLPFRACVSRQANAAPSEIVGVMSSRLEQEIKTTRAAARGSPHSALAVSAAPKYPHEDSGIACEFSRFIVATSQVFWQNPDLNPAAGLAKF